MKVTLLGDSIRMAGYGPLVPALLGDGYEVYQPNDNCRFAKYTLRGLFDWENQMAGSQIVHWNNGLWDFCDLFGDGPFSTQDEYKTNILRIADILLARHDTVIFATTTPVTEQNVYDKNPVIRRYNRLIVPLLEEKGVIINDLHSTVSKDIDRYIRKDDNIRLTDEGARVCAKQVAAVIKPFPTPPVPPGRRPATGRSRFRPDCPYDALLPPCPQKQACPTTKIVLQSVSCVP